MKVYLDMVGCRLNQSEIETIARQFRAAGHSLVGEAGKADLVVINTCAVTAEAASDSRQKVRQASRAGAGRIVVTGCWSALNPGDAAALPGVSQVVANERKERLAADVLDLPVEVFDREPLARQPLPGMRQRTRAFIKAQDGCNNRCTFCVTRLARGPAHSRSVNDILAEIQAAQAGGAREIVLTGVHLGSWGHDFTPRGSLADLIRAILAGTGVPRLRLSSLEPWDLDESFFSLWEDPRLCRHVHLPLQSGSATVLRRMARKTTPESFRELVTTARRIIPGLAVTTDVIVGFPGESESEFTESLEYIRETGFAGGHVFTYSLRPGTAAARFPDQVPAPVRKERNARMRAVLEADAVQYRQRFQGVVMDVLWESADSVGPEGWRMSGLTDNYLRVSAVNARALWNRISRVELAELDVEGLCGRIVG